MARSGPSYWRASAGKSSRPTSFRGASWVGMGGSSSTSCSSGLQNGLCTFQSCGHTLYELYVAAGEEVRTHHLLTFLAAVVRLPLSWTLPRTAHQRGLLRPFDATPLRSAHMRIRCACDLRRHLLLLLPYFRHSNLVFAPQSGEWTIYISLPRIHASKLASADDLEGNV